MTKVAMLLAGFLSLNGALAAEPKVSCQLNWVETDAQGITVDVKRSPSKAVRTGQPTVIGLEGFKLTASLRQICASDGGPCTDSYDLDSTIETGDEVSAHTSKTVKAGGFDRSYLNLKTGRVSAFSLCDVE